MVNLQLFSNIMEKDIADKDGYVTFEQADALVDTFYEYANKATKNGEFSFCEKSKDAVLVRLKNGLNFAYMPSIRGQLANQVIGSDIINKEPLETGRSDDAIPKIIVIDKKSKNISLNENIVYCEVDESIEVGGKEDKYIAKELSMRNLKSLNNDLKGEEFISISTHGNYFNDLGATIRVTDKYNKVNEFIYNLYQYLHIFENQKDIFEKLDKIKQLSNNGINGYSSEDKGCYVVDQNGFINITPKFLDTYMKDNAFFGSTVILGFCSSAKDKDEKYDVNNPGSEMIKVFFKKGAYSVIGSNDLITDRYLNIFAYDFYEKYKKFGTELDDKEQCTKAFIETENKNKNEYEVLKNEYENYKLDKDKFEKIDKNTKQNTKFKCFVNKDKKGIQVLKGKVYVLNYQGVLDMQGIQDPNPGSYRGDFYVILKLDSPTKIEASSGSENGYKYYRESNMIQLTDEKALDYNGDNLKIEVDSSNIFWPSDTSLPLGEPSTSIYKIVK